MPSVSERQRRFMGAELARKRAGEQTRTGMTESQLKDFSRKPKLEPDMRGMTTADAARALSTR